MLKKSLATERMKITVRLFFETMYSGLIKLVSRRKKTRKQSMIKKGTAKVEEALDIINLVKSMSRLKALEHHFFSLPQRTLLRMNRANYLSEGGPTSPDE